MQIAVDREEPEKGRDDRESSEQTSLPHQTVTNQNSIERSSG
ncbi:MAG: hypothetical protein SWY16_04695 [Cyanobacteriota bacterium]|nr:hypothetical protein [Cyanobacteriota bacterium]